MMGSTTKVMFRIFMLAAMVLFNTNVCKAKMYGVFYAANGDNLNCPENDVTDLASLYRERGGNVILIRGDGVTRNTVLSSIRRQACACTQDDIIMFAYSGHGNNGLIACGNSDIIRFSEIKHEMSLAKARRKVLFIDACYSGSASNGGGLIQGNYDESNALIFTASKSNQMSSEIQGARNSVFYSALLHGLKGKADKNNDGKVTAQEIYNYVKSHSFFQEPTMIGRFDKNMVLATVMDNDIDEGSNNDVIIGAASNIPTTIASTATSIVAESISNLASSETLANTFVDNKKENNNFMGITFLSFSWLSFAIGIIATVFAIWLVFKVIHLMLKFINWVCGNVL